MATMGLRAAALAGCVALAASACNEDDDIDTQPVDSGSPTGDAGHGGVDASADGSTGGNIDSGTLIDAAKPAVDAGAQAAVGIAKLKHLVVIYLENHSFDNLYGSWPGAEGISNAKSVTQLDATGTAFTTLPQMDPQIPTTLENKPFDITTYAAPNQKTIDLVHRFYQEQLQINDGKMDMFAAISDAKGLSMGYYPTAKLPLVGKLNALGGQVTVLDHFFHAAFGGSFLNHIWLIAAASPEFPGAPETSKAKLDANGKLMTDGAITPDGFVVNTSYSVNTPHPATAKPETLVPSQKLPTIGDRLSDKSVDWAWYSGGWNDALAGKADALFQFHHQPFVYFESFADGKPAKTAHLKDESEFIDSAEAGSLPAVSFVKPIGANNEHPGYADLASGESHVVELVNTITQSPTWNDTAIIITYDENGGFWDHVSPPKTDKWGPGSRVPGIVISPFAKGGVDSTVYDTTAILKLISERWGTQPLNGRDSAQNSIADHAFNFSK